MADRATSARTLSALAAAVILALTVAVSGAVEPGEALPDPALEARARAISKDLRCLVCQNQSIDDSDAELAHDLRKLVRERLRAGDTDARVIDYVVSRYGDFVLLRPPLKASTYLLWFGTPLALLMAVVAIVAYYRNRQRRVGEVAAPLSAADEERLARVLEDQKE